MRAGTDSVMRPWLRGGVCALLSVGVLVASSGCVSVAASKETTAKIDAAPVARAIVLCTTTLDDLRRQLGDPTRDGRLHGQHVVSWITAWDPLVRYLAVLVDARGVVVDLYWDVPTEVTWVPTSQCGS